MVWYLKGTQNLQLCLGGTNPTKLISFTDASYACCPNSGKSVSAYCFSLGASMIFWAAHKQQTVAQSTCSAEYSQLPKVTATSTEHMLAMSTNRFVSFVHRTL
jgi:hypothetical protein